VRWFFGLFISSCLDRTYLEVFLIWPVIHQGRAKFCSFGAVGDCAKRAYAPSPTAHNAFFLTSWAQKKNSNVLFNGNYMMFIKYFFKDCLFSFTGSFKVAFSLSAFFIL
jgi:hypothetical protein